MVYARCVRIGAHSNSDKHELYRSPEELAEVRAQDPLPRVRAHCLAHGVTEAELADERRLAHERAVADQAGPGTETFHQTSTCMMGPGTMAVVDTDLKVKGVDGLRVVDASIMPTVISGNTNAAVIMIAEKGADMILGRAA